MSLSAPLTFSTLCYFSAALDPLPVSENFEAVLTSMFWKPVILGSWETRLVDPKLKVSKTCLIGTL